jgi:trimeric autotransporter adhesin
MSAGFLRVRIAVALVLCVLSCVGVARSRTQFDRARAGDLDTLRAAPVMRGVVGRQSVGPRTVSRSGGIRNVVSRMSGPAGPQLNPELWGADGPVTSLVTVGHTLYASGYFRSVGENSGGFVGVDATTASAVPGLPKVDGAVFVVVPDGAGGWYLGGEFTSVGGLPRDCIAHVLADATVAPWNPGRFDSDDDFMRPRVYTIVPHGRKVYIAGSFSAVGGQPRENLAAVDTSGAVTEWNPHSGLWGEVYALAARDSIVFVGGMFDSLGGQSRQCLAAVNAVNGQVLPWDPKALGVVRALLLRGDTLLVGGDFYGIGIEEREMLAAIDVPTATLLPWNARVTGISIDYAMPPSVWALQLVQDTLWVAGDFVTIGGREQASLSALNVSTGDALDWTPPVLSPHRDGYPPPVCYSVLEHRGVVYFAGLFGAVDDSLQSYVAAADAVTGARIPWNPKVSAAVEALSARGDAILIGGEFTTIGEWKHRAGLAAIDLETGRLRPWNPNPDGLGVTKIVYHDGRLYVAGDFVTIGGQVRNYIAALDTVNGEADDWDPEPDDFVECLLVQGDTLFVGGDFMEIAGVPRTRLAALDAHSGDAFDWSPAPSWGVFALAAADQTIYVGGIFQRVGGISRPCLAAIDRRTGELLPWNPDAGLQWVNVLLVDGDKIYAGGQFLAIGGVTRKGLAAIDRHDGRLTHWDANACCGINADPEVYDLALVDSLLYVAGDFASIGGEARTNLAAVDTVTGAATSWDPEPNELVRSLAATPGALYVGGRFSRIASTPCAGIAGFTVPTRPVVPRPSWLRFAVTPNPALETALARFSLPSDGPVHLRVFDLQGRLVATVFEGTKPAGTYSQPIPIDRMRSGIYFCRLDACGSTRVGKFAVLR